jgi:hypothetical protein
MYPFQEIRLPHWCANTAISLGARIISVILWSETIALGPQKFRVKSPSHASHEMHIKPFAPAPEKSVSRNVVSPLMQRKLPIYPFTMIISWLMLPPRMFTASRRMTQIKEDAWH